MTREKSSDARSNGIFLKADWVIRERKRRGWGRRELAAKALVSSMTISNIERGYPCLPITAVAIRRAFDENLPVLDGALDEQRSA